MTRMPQTGGFWAPDPPGACSKPPGVMVTVAGRLRADAGESVPLGAL